MKYLCLRQAQHCTLCTAHSILCTTRKPVNERASAHFIEQCTHLVGEKRVLQTSFLFNKTLQRNIGISFYMVVKLVRGGSVVNKATQSCSFYFM